MSDLQMTETWWACLSKNYMPSIYRTKREALEERKNCLIANAVDARVCKVKIVEVK
jgi:hypothetical protein